MIRATLRVGSWSNIKSTSCGAAKRPASGWMSRWSHFAPDRSPGRYPAQLAVRSDFSGQTFKHILPPVWVLAYVYGSRSYQVVVNGYTGAIAGKYPLSWIKITVAVLATIALIVILLVIFHGFQRCRSSPLLRTGGAISR